MRAYIWTPALLALATDARAVPPPTTPLTGTVHAADGTPAAGALVWAAKLSFGPLEHRETVADDEGRYKLELEPSSWFLWARRGTQGGEGPALHEPVEIVADRAPPPVRIRMEERGTFRGRLLDADTDDPIAGARLFLDMGLALVTDAKGRFTMGGLSRTHHEAFVVAPGRMRMRVLFDTTGRADTELEVPVPRAGTIVGRVTDPDGQPIPGAYVGRHTSGSYFATNGLFVPCDAKGRFEYDDAAPPGQPTRLTAHAPGYQEEQRDDLTSPVSGKPLEVEFRLRPAPGTKKNAKAPPDEKRRQVSGVVVGPDSKPVAGVLVRWGYQPFVGAIEIRTDAKGRFRLTVPDSANMLAVLPADFTPQFPQVPAGGDQVVNVMLERGSVAGGKVVDDRGKPIEGVRVVAVVASPDPRIGNPFWLSEAMARTDAAGRFEVKGVPAGAHFDLLKSGLTDERNKILNLGGADNTITMLHGGAVSGRVVDRHGKPIRQFRILVGFPDNRLPDDKTEGFFAGYSGIGVRFTSADGSFVLTGVGAGSVYRITAVAYGHGDAIVDRVMAVPLNHLSTAQPATLQAGRTTELHVRAVTADGKPIAGARVTLVNGSRNLDKSFSWGYDDAGWENMVRSRTEDDGWADFPILGFGGATVVVQAPGYARQRVGWRDGKRAVMLELAPEAIIAGEVTTATGVPLKTFYVGVNSGGERISTSVGPPQQGRFRIAGLPAGEWTLTIRGTDGLSVLHEERVTLRAGETRQLKVQAQPE
jgi:hypothetical protein